MPEFTQMIRWNAGFVRGLAESVLARAKVIRETLETSISKKPLVTKAKKKNVAAKKALKRVSKAARKTKRNKN